MFGSSEPTSNGVDEDRKGSASLDPVKLAKEWGVDAQLWGREWNTLSGGEGQRIALAIAISLGGAEIVLLDGESKVYKS
jgi:ABC-type dipeptide/oligopeptide/nickel transport system ATPase subunit